MNYVLGNQFSLYSRVDVDAHALAFDRTNQMEKMVYLDLHVHWTVYSVYEALLCKYTNSISSFRRLRSEHTGEFH